jgi:hypothetical protein
MMSAKQDLPLDLHVSVASPVVYMNQRSGDMSSRLHAAAVRLHWPGVAAVGGWWN